MRKREILRILDANLNRAREGLRVCEDILRFSLGDKELTHSFKLVRYNISTLLRAYGLGKIELLRHRNSRFDVGRDLTVRKKKKLGVVDLFCLNIQRAQEALRVLEEVSKAIDANLETKFRRMRFRLYTLESRATEKLTEYDS